MARAVGLWLVARTPVLHFEIPLDWRPGNARRARSASPSLCCNTTFQEASGQLVVDCVKGQESQQGGGPASQENSTACGAEDASQEDSKIDQDGVPSHRAGTWRSGQAAERLTPGPPKKRRPCKAHRDRYRRLVQDLVAKAQESPETFWTSINRMHTLPRWATSPDGDYQRLIANVMKHVKIPMGASH